MRLPAPPGPAKVFLIDLQDAAQTMLMQVLPAPQRRSDDYYALTLANAVWGGAATARLGENIREQKGYSYGVFSFLQLRSAGRLCPSRPGTAAAKSRS